MSCSKRTIVVHYMGGFWVYKFILTQLTFIQQTCPRVYKFILRCTYEGIGAFFSEYCTPYGGGAHWRNMELKPTPTKSRIWSKDLKKQARLKKIMIYWKRLFTKPRKNNAVFWRRVFFQRARNEKICVRNIIFMSLAFLLTK